MNVKETCTLTTFIQTGIQCSSHMYWTSVSVNVIRIRARIRVVRRCDAYHHTGTLARIMYTAISIKVVPTKKVDEYERERLIGKD